MGRKVPELSKKAATLVAAFDKAAQRHGWEKDQGHIRADVEGAALEHQQTFEELARYIASLERVKQKRDKVRRHLRKVRGGDPFAAPAGGF